MRQGQKLKKDAMGWLTDDPAGGRAVHALAGWVIRLTMVDASSRS